MKIVGRYSFNNGDAVIKEKYPHLLQEIEEVIHSIDAALYKDKESKEKTMTC